MVMSDRHLESEDELPMDVSIVSVYAYEGMVILAFIDEAGEHGAAMSTTQAREFASSIERAVHSLENGDDNVN